MGTITNSNCRKLVSANYTIIKKVPEQKAIKYLTLKGHWAVYNNFRTEEEMTLRFRELLKQKDFLEFE